VQLFFDDDDAGASSVNSNARLVSPVINLVGVASPKLSFKYANMIYDLDSTIKVEVFNGTSGFRYLVLPGIPDSGELIGIRLCIQSMLMIMLQISI
jgi:hypothetical protein